MYQVILGLGIGNFLAGHPVISVQLLNQHRHIILRCQGELPPAPDLAALYEDWFTQYRSHYQGQDLNVRIQLEPGAQPQRLSRYEFNHTSDQLAQCFNDWLSYPAFAEVEQKLRTSLKPTDEIQIIVETTDQEQRRFPWHLWRFLADYRCSEIALSLPESKRGQNGPSQTRPGTIRLLGVLGSVIAEDGEQGVDLVRDRTIIEAIPHLDSTFQDQPSKAELTHTLWSEPWDILFVAGHGSTPKDQTNGIILNQRLEDNRLTATDFKFALQNAVDQGLKLVILNACDSIDLASELAELDIAQIIAFRHAVPDVIAQTFLQYFLTAFTQGQSTYLALRAAREQLQSVDGSFPCASWLPVICQNPTVPPPRLADLLRSPPEPPKRLARVKRPTSMWLPLVWSLVGVLLILGARSMGWLQGLELQAYDQLMRWQPPAEPDSRFLIVTVDEADIQYQDQENMTRRGSLAEPALTQLLAKLNAHGPRVIGLDILHPYAFESEWATAPIAPVVFIAPCEIGQTDERPTTVPAAPNLPPKQLGFIDLVIDPDRVIRRQLLFMDAVPSCNTEQSLSLRIAEAYLAQAKFPTVQFTNAQTLKLGHAELHRLSADAGGYQLPPSDALGYQILVNYRAASFPQVSLREVLSGTLDVQLPDLVANRIILIGVADGANDLHLTPTTGGSWPVPMAGVLVHANMISHLVSVAKQERPQIWWWPTWIEMLWISSWSLSGMVVILLIRHAFFRGATIIMVMCSLIAISFLVLLNGGWIPLVPAGLGLMLTSIGTSMIIKPANLK